MEEIYCSEVGNFDSRSREERMCDGEYGAAMHSHRVLSQRSDFQRHVAEREGGGEGGVNGGKDGRVVVGGGEGGEGARHAPLDDVSPEARDEATGRQRLDVNGDVSALGPDADAES